MMNINELLASFVHEPEDPEINYQLGCYYEDLGQYSSAGSYFLRAAERYEDNTLIYECLVRLASSILSLKRRRYSVKGILSYAISFMPNRPEAYYMLGNLIEYNEDNEEKWFTIRSYASIALEVCDFEGIQPLRKKTSYDDKWSLIFQKAYASFHLGFIEESRKLFLSIVNSDDTSEYLKKLSRNNLMMSKKEHKRAVYYHEKSDLKDVYDVSLGKYVLENGGSIHPIVVDSSLVGKHATTNCSVYVHEGKVLVNARRTTYVIYKTKRFFGKNKPLYFNPEDDLNIRSENIICELDDSLNVVSSKMVKMKKESQANWFYMGLEDPRLVVWNGKMYLSGVRRDELGEGVGRMSMSEILITENDVKEISRVTIPAPAPNDSYCEKNWMPILDKPFHWIKWSNPTQVVYYDVDKKETYNAHIDENKVYDFPNFLKGSSQIVEWYDYYIGITHEVEDDEELNRARYYQRILVWDKNWNIVCSTRKFTMMSGIIEFVTGIAFHNDDVLISYGHEDHSAFVLKIPRKTFDNFVLRG